MGHKTQYTMNAGKHKTILRRQEDIVAYYFSYGLVRHLLKTSVLTANVTTF